MAAMFAKGSGRNEQVLYRGPFIDASYQVSVHLAKRFQRRKILEIDQPETRIAYSVITFVNESGRNEQSL